MSKESKKYFLPSIKISIAPAPINLEEMKKYYEGSDLSEYDQKDLFTSVKYLEYCSKYLTIIDKVIRDWNKKGTFFEMFRQGDDNRGVTITIAYNLFKEKYLEKLPQDIADLKEYLNVFKQNDFKITNPTTDIDWDITTREFENIFHDELKTQTINDLPWKRFKLKPIFENTKPKYTLTETDGTVLITPPPKSCEN